MKKILPCCDHQTIYQLTFVNDDYVYHVCEECSKFQHWTRNIESKKGSRDKKLNKTIMFYPNPDSKPPVEFQRGYDAWLERSCKHKGQKSISYLYYTTLKDSCVKKGYLNYKYTFKVCKKCFEKNHEQWRKGINLPIKYPENEILHFWDNSNIKSTGNLK